MTSLSIPDIALKVYASMRNGITPSVTKYVDLTVVKAVDERSRKCTLVGVEDLRGRNPTNMLNILEQTQATLCGATRMVYREYPGFNINPVAIYLISGEGDKEYLDAAMHLYMESVFACSEDKLWHVQHGEKGIPVWEEKTLFQQNKTVRKHGPPAYRGAERVAA